MSPVTRLSRARPVSRQACLAPGARAPVSRHVQGTGSTPTPSAGAAPATAPVVRAPQDPSPTTPVVAAPAQGSGGPSAAPSASPAPAPKDNAARLARPEVALGSAALAAVLLLLSLA